MANKATSVSMGCNSHHSGALIGVGLFVEACPALLALIGNASLAVDRRGAVHDLLDARGMLVQRLDRDDRAAATNGFSMVIGLVFIDPGRGQRTDQAASRRACNPPAAVAASQPAATTGPTPRTAVGHVSAPDTATLAVIMAGTTSRIHQAAHCSVAAAITRRNRRLENPRF